MLTPDELNALVQLADRAAKSPAETLWLAGLIAKVNAALKEAAAPPDAPAP